LLEAAMLNAGDDVSLDTKLEDDGDNTTTGEAAVERADKGTESDVYGGEDRDGNAGINASSKGDGDLRDDIDAELGDDRDRRLGTRAARAAPVEAGDADVDSSDNSGDEGDNEADEDSEDGGDVDAQARRGAHLQTHLQESDDRVVVTLLSGGRGERVDAQRHEDDGAGD